MIIGEIDNQFASLSKEEIAKNAIEDSTYENLFKIETTSSYEARGGGNQPLKRDRANELINEKI